MWTGKAGLYLGVRGTRPVLRLGGRRWWADPWAGPRQGYCRRGGSPAPRRRERSQSLAAGWAVLQLPPAGFVQLCPAAPFPDRPGRAQPPLAMPPAGPRGTAPLAAVVLLVLGAPLGKGWRATRDGWGGVGRDQGEVKGTSEAILRLSVSPRCLRLFLEQEERALRGQAVGT